LSYCGISALTQLQINYVQGAKAFYSKWVPERQGDMDSTKRTLRFNETTLVNQSKTSVKLALNIDLREYLQPKYPRKEGRHGTPHYILA
jgi:hypothetical protein